MEIVPAPIGPEESAMKLAIEAAYERRSLPQTAQERFARVAKQKAARLAAKRARKARRAGR